MIQVFTIISASAFIFYGFLILVSNHMVQEFRRYQLTRYRTFTGWLELAGGMGQLAGLIHPSLLIASSLGLALLMLLGTVVRIRTKDPWPQTLPAIGLFLLNLCIALSAIF